jgi:protein O-GlcNAc transferase
MNIREAIQAAIQNHQAGNLQEAENIYKEILTVQPENFYALHYIGVLYTQLGNMDLAIRYIEKALQVNPADSHACYNLGIALHAKGMVDAAINSYRRSLELNPQNTDALVNIGNALKEKGELDQAEIHLRKALELSPSNAAALYNLGYVLQIKGFIDEAIASYKKSIQVNPHVAAAYFNLGYLQRKQGLLKEAKDSFEFAIQLNPGFADAYNALGITLYETGLLDDAQKYLEKAIQLNPHFADAYNNLGIVYQDKQLPDDAIACYQKALLIDPDLTEIYANLGNVLHMLGRQDEALAALDRAVQCRPDSLTARWSRCMCQLPILYPDSSALDLCRHRYGEELFQLQKTVCFDTFQAVDEAAQAVGRQQPFFLPCQPFNNRELQQTYGDLVCRIMGKRYPQFADRRKMPTHSDQEPIRVGFVSKFFCWHSVWKIPLRGWLENLDKNFFSIYAYHTGKQKDHATQEARQCSARFVEDVYSFDTLCRIIRNDNLHVLIYPEIGMDPMTVRLAALRLAPVQCVSLGHPETTGLPTIDYYLSSELMESADADEHYTEKLIRLPNLGFFYTPFNSAAVPATRTTYGLHPEAVLYLCSHALFTHLPQYDEIYPGIAKQTGNCRFVFISHRSKYITEQFRERIKKAFFRENLNAEKHVVILPRLTQESYHALNKISDVFLDTMGWSANNSTFEALACNLPVVTLPGKLMRQRHCCGILAMMGITETVASSINEYTEIAVRLGKDPAWRHHIADKIAANKHILYRDRTPITALEDFLKKVLQHKDNL